MQPSVPSRRRGRKRFLVLVALGAAGCGSDPTSPAPEASVVGTYVRQTYGDRPLPAEFGGYVYEAETMTLDLGGTARRVRQGRWAGSSVTNRVDDAQYRWWLRRDTILVAPTVGSQVDTAVAFAYRFTGRDTLRTLGLGDVWTRGGPPGAAPRPWPW